MIHFKLISSTGVKFDGDIYEVIVPTQGGTVAIFKDHMPLVSAASPGVLSIRKNSSDKDSEIESYAINGGILETDGKNVRFMSEDISTSEEINVAQAEAAMKRAEEAIKNAKTHSALVDAEHLLKHYSAQLHVARLKKRHHR